jgi:hypothetical protein
MRNDARPIGEDIGRQSPVPSHHTPPDESKAPADRRDRVTHDRQSRITNRRAEDNVRRKDTDVDPVMPAGDSTLKTKI